MRLKNCVLNIMCVTTIGSMIALLPQQTYAKDGEKKHSDKPYEKYRGGVKSQLQALNERIDMLEASIGNVTIKLDDLQTQVENNSLAISETMALASQLKSNLSDLEMTVINNALAIGEVSMTIAMLTTEVEYQKNQLTTVILEQTAAIESNAEQLRALQESVLAMGQNNMMLAQELKAKMLELEAYSDLSQAQVAEMQTQVNTLASQLSAANADYNYLQLVVEILEKALADAHAQLDELQSTVALISGGVGTSLPEEASSGPAVFTFTDTFDTDDTMHVTQLRTFLSKNSAVDTWVYASFVTAAINRSTEICFQDTDDLFSTARNLSEHAYDDQIGGDHATYRLNGGSWVGVSSIRIQSRNSNGYSYIFTGASGSDLATAALINLTTNAQNYDTYHQRRYQTIESQSDTVVSYTIAKDRMTACGF